MFETPHSTSQSNTKSSSKRRHSSFKESTFLLLYLKSTTTMVFFKITDGAETRRFQVTPGEITFQQLQERIATLFPEAAKEASNLTLRYRDSDGDVITLSSDEEFQEVLTNLPSDHVWKLHIHTPSKTTRSCHRVSQLLQSPFAVRRNPWSDLDELVELFFGLNDTKPSSEEKTTSKENTENTTSEEAAEPSTTENQDSGATEEQEGAKPSKATPKEGEDEEVKSKHPKKTGSECPAGHHCHVKRVHLWEPTLFGGLFGPRVFSPSVGYHITYTPRAQATAASSA